MTDYNAPETALLDLDWLIDQAALFITANAVECELAARVSSHRIDLWDNPELRREAKLYLAHISVEEVYDPFLDRMGKLELACRKEEVSRRLGRLIAGSIYTTTRKAA